jgi:hypothetical protein
MQPESESVPPPAGKMPEPQTDLPWYIAMVRKEKATVKGAPISFATCVIICTALLGIGIFTIDQWHYSGTISEKDSTIIRKDADLGQKDDTIRTISEERDAANRENDKLHKDNEWLRNFRSKDSTPIKQEAIILANQIHDYIKDWKDTEPPEQQYHNVQQYVARFGLRASLMRDDLDKAGQDSKEFDSVMWNFDGSYKEVRLIADSIQKLADNLPDSAN